MAKPVLISLAAVIIFIFLAGLFIQKYPNFNFPGKNNVQELSQSVTVGDTTINVELANTKAAREKGLSGRSSLPENTGMLFVFDAKQVSTSFWMKDMLIPLDILWISNNKVVKIDENVPAPPPNLPTTNLETFSSNGPVDYVLEVNAGFASKSNIKVGDLVELSALII